MSRLAARLRRTICNQLAIANRKLFLLAFCLALLCLLDALFHSRLASTRITHFYSLSKPDTFSWLVCRIGVILPSRSEMVNNSMPEAKLIGEFALILPNT